MAIMLITHDMGVVAETAQRVVVMYAGKVVEEATVERALRRAAPSLHAGPHPLDPAHRPRGDRTRRASRRSRASCRRLARSAARLPASRRAAASRAPTASSSDAAARAKSRRATRCACCAVLRRAGACRMTEAAAARQGPREVLPDQRRPVLARGRAGARGRRRQLRARRRRDARARRRVGLRQVDDRPLHPAPDRADLGRGLVRGQGRDGARQAAELRALRRDMQIIFQDPYASLNPRMTVGAIIGEALIDPQARQDAGARRGARRPAARDGRPQRRPHAPLPARVLGRPAPAHRHRPRARGRARS